MHRHLLAFVAAVPCGFTTAQTFHIQDFSTPGIVELAGDAQVLGSTLRLTEAGLEQTGAGWYQDVADVTGGFDTTFEFRMTPGSSRGEGFAFVLRSSVSPIGDGGAALGYGGEFQLSPRMYALVVEIDTLQTAGRSGDHSDNEISVHIGSQSDAPDIEGVPGIGFRDGATIPFDIVDGQSHQLRIRYDVAGILDVYLDDLITPLLSVEHDIELRDFTKSNVRTQAFYLPHGRARPGFTGATSATGSQTVDILEWSWTSEPLAPPCAAGATGLGGLDILYREGNPSNLLPEEPTFGLRRLTLPSFEAFEFELSSPLPGANVFALFAGVGRPTGATTLPTPYGDFCFAPGTPLSFGIGVAPTTIPIPAGLPLLGEVTVQGVFDVGGTTLTVTNAVTLRFVPMPTPTIRSVRTNHFPAVPKANVSGGAFSELAVIRLGGVPVPSDWVHLYDLQFEVPVGTPCDTPLTITNPDGGTVNGVVYPTPTVTGVTSGPTAVSGGEIVRLEGFGLAQIAQVDVDGVAAFFPPGLNNDDSFVFVAPPGSQVGPATVTLTTVGGCTATATLVYQ